MSIFQTQRGFELQKCVSVISKNGSAMIIVYYQTIQDWHFANTETKSRRQWLLCKCETFSIEVIICLTSYSPTNRFGTNPSSKVPWRNKTVNVQIHQQKDSVTDIWFLLKLAKGYLCCFSCALGANLIYCYCR